MWIMTKYGFFSIVRARSNRVSDRIQVRPHPNLMMIRARNRDHLEALRAAFTLSGDIVATKNTDYPYRVDLVAGGRRPNNDRSYARCGLYQL